MTGRRIRRSAAIACAVLLGVPASVWAADILRASPLLAQGISLVAQASPTSIGLGSGFVDSATLTPAGGGPAPTGTISFSVYGPSDPGCGGPVLFNATNTVTSKPTLSGAYTTPAPSLTPPNLGTYHVVVTYNGDGNYAALATPCGDPANTVVVGPRPTLTTISPNSGPAGGGNTVTITGTNLTDATGVNFGSIVTTATVLSPTQVLTTAPAGSGAVSVTVTTQFGTTTVVPAGLYTYAAPGAPPVPAGLTPITVSPQPPTAETGPVGQITSSTAQFTGTVGPSALGSTAEFEYTVRLAGGRAITRRTPEQVVGVLGRRITADVSGLLPKSRYRVRLLATSVAGATTGAATSFLTPAAARPRSPVVGETFDATPVSGVVFVRVPGSGEPVVPLTDARQLPVGTTLDTRDGVVRLTTATTTAGRTASGSFGGATVRLTQSRAKAGLAELGFVRASTSRQVCASSPGQARPETPLASLRATTSGRFAVRGRYGSATGSKATWKTTDRCDGLLASVGRGSVEVGDFRLGRTVGVNGGGTYFARAL